MADDRRPTRDMLLRLPPHLARALDQLAALLDIDRTATLKLALVRLSMEHGIPIEAPVPEPDD